MASLNESKAFWTLLLLIVYAVGYHCFQRERKLNLSTPEECQTGQLGESWTSTSKAACAAECLNRYPDSCQSFAYNNQTKTCRAGKVAFRPSDSDYRPTSIPESNSTDVIYFTDQPVPACTKSGFTLYSSCGQTLCLHKAPSKANYADALTNCGLMGGRLYIANTMAKFVLFMNISFQPDIAKPHAWIGITDLAQWGIEPD